MNYCPADSQLQRMRSICIDQVISKVIPYVEDTTETFSLREIQETGLPSGDQLYVFFAPRSGTDFILYTYRTSNPELAQLIYLVCDYAAYDNLTSACIGIGALNERRMLLIHRLKDL